MKLVNTLKRFINMEQKNSKLSLIKLKKKIEIVWQGNSLLLIGTSDFDRVFHPLGLSLNSRESQ